ncbi:MAG: hypothetical protein JO110_20560 [Acetobacteraceae bacterium]|nr:hypothetical protein [Acetobacteraceae bacterium]
MTSNLSLCSSSVHGVDRSLLPTGLSDRLALIIAALRGVLAAHMAKDRSAVAVLFLAWTRLGRLASRFEALVTARSAPGGFPPRRRHAGTMRALLNCPCSKACRSRFGCRVDLAG